MERQVKRWELVELLVPNATVGRATFNTIPQLRNQTDQIIVIKSIEIFDETTYANSQLTSALPGLPVADVPKAVVVLYVNGEESIKMIPLAKFINSGISGTNPIEQYPFNLGDLANVDFDKSYVQFATASSGGPYVIPFGISYVRLVKSSSGMALNTTTPGGNFIEG